MKLWKLTTFYTVFLLILSGCAGSTPVPKQETVVDSTLPMIEITKNGILPDMQAIAFEWNSVSNPRVEGIYIYKAVVGEKGSELKYYKSLEGRFSTHFIDTDVRPDTVYKYSFKTFSKEAESKQTPVITVHSLAVLKSVAWIYSKTGMPRTAKIIWRPHNNRSVKSYIIERRTVEDKEWEELAVVAGRLSAEYIDKGLDDDSIYQYRIRVQTYDDIISAPSEEVKIVTKALPVSIKNIQASSNLPKEIKITWKESKAKDFAQYYLYRSEYIDGSYELIAKLYNNKFMDKIKEDGKIYFYRVSVVDKDGLESLHDKLSIKGQTLVKPQAPEVLHATLIANSIKVTWNRTDTRSRNFILVRKHKKGWFETIVKEFRGLGGKQYIDTNIEADSEYTYTIYAVDKNGVVSNPSKEVTIVIPESNEIISEPEAKVEVKKGPKVQEIKIEDIEEIIAPMSDMNVDEL